MLGFAELFVIFFIIFLAVLIPTIFFMIAQQETLKAIRPENREMSPGEVWLQLIPIFNLVWMFIVVTRISNSIDREMASTQNFSFEDNQYVTGYVSSERPTYQIGIAYCVLSCCSIIPFLGWLASIAALVCWITYWVKLADYKKKI